MQALRATQNLISGAADMIRLAGAAGAFLSMVVLNSCSQSSTPQDNFLIDARTTGAEMVAAQLSRALHATMTSDNVATPGSPPVKMFRLDGSGFVVILAPLPDDRCTVRAHRQPTYSNGQYRIDLVYKRSSIEFRENTKKSLWGAVRDLGVPIRVFSRCVK